MFEIHLLVLQSEHPEDGKNVVMHVLTELYSSAVIVRL